MSFQDMGVAETNRWLFFSFGKEGKRRRSLIVIFIILGFVALAWGELQARGRLRKIEVVNDYLDVNLENQTLDVNVMNQSVDTNVMTMDLETSATTSFSHSLRTFHPHEWSSGIMQTLFIGLGKSYQAKSRVIFRQNKTGRFLESQSKNQ
jgi:hypothetical protein